MTAPAARIRAFDWLRGLAVLFMIQCHALTLLKPALRESFWEKRLIWADGLVAPSFIFAAGFSLALVQVRGAAAGTRGTRLIKTLRRLGEVLFVATLVNLAWFRFPLMNGELKWLLRVDILQCIGLSLLIALPLLAGLATRPSVLRWVTLALAVATFALSPFGEWVHGGWAMLANQTTGAVFPLLPWAGYVYLGASAGATAATGDVWRLIRWISGLGALGLCLWLGDRLWSNVYPASSAWLVPNHGNRIFVLALLVLFLLCAEYRLVASRLKAVWTLGVASAFAFVLGATQVFIWVQERSIGALSLACGAAIGVWLLALESKVGTDWKTSRALRFVETFGASSLSGYFFHEMLLYDTTLRHPCFHSLWGDSCGWTKYYVLTAALIVTTYLLVRLMDWFYGFYDRWVRRALGVG
jgi:uncharacterized membrane protein